MTYGDLPAEHHQQQFETLGLHEFQRLDMDLGIPDERRYTEPVQATDVYALDEEDTKAKTYIVMSWLLGRSADLYTIMEAHLLADVLLDNSASPLRHALETSELGTAPAPVCGLDDSAREASFICGIEGSEPEHADAVQALILDVLERVAAEGVAQAQVEAVLHQIELSQREIGGGHFPYGLQLMVNALSPALHGGDPAGVLDIDPVLTRLREAAADPGYIPSLVRKLLLDNPHRVSLVFSPDSGLSERKAMAEAERLARLKEALNDAQKDDIVELSHRLEARQRAQDDPELLPKVTLEDVPAELKIATGAEERVAGMDATWYAQGTNGLVYVQTVVELPDMEPALKRLLPVFCEVCTEVGCGQQDYRQMQNRQAAVSGGIGTLISVRGAVDEPQRIRAVFAMSGNALCRNRDGLSELMRDMFVSARFDEHERLRELIAQSRAYSEAQVIQRGHVLAMIAATAGLAPSAALTHSWSGLEGIKALKTLDDSLNDAAAVAALADKLEQIRDHLLTAPRKLLLIGEEAQHQALGEAVTSHWGDLEVAANGSTFSCPEPHGRDRVGWSTSTQVSFSAKAYPAVASVHEDAAVLTVLGPFLHNGYLHRSIREQGGAYGSGAQYDSDTGTFRFFSYRDPRLADTLTDFDASVTWLLDNNHEPRTVEEAILSIISSIDRPESPSGEATAAYFAALHGRTPEQRRRFRSRVLEVTLDDLKRVAATYLNTDLASVGVLSDAKTLQGSDLGLTVQQL